MDNEGHKNDTILSGPGQLPNRPTTSAVTSKGEISRPDGRHTMPFQPDTSLIRVHGDHHNLWQQILIICGIAQNRLAAQQAAKRLRFLAPRMPKSVDSTSQGLKLLPDEGLKQYSCYDRPQYTMNRELENIHGRDDLHVSAMLRWIPT
jgi:hypothetical protein